MENVAIALGLALFFWWALPRYLINIINRIPAREYNCTLTKDIYNNKITKIGPRIATFQHRITLPFQPQQGMLVSDVIYFPNSKNMKKDDIDEDSIFFGPEKIESVVWNNGPRHFVCTIATYQMSEKDELGAIVINHIRKGWRVNYIEYGGQNAVNNFMKEWKIQIETEERKSGECSNNREINSTQRILDHFPL